MKNFKTKNAGILSVSDFKTLKGRVVYTTFIIFLSVTSVISLIPAIWTVLTAFKETQEIYSSMSFFPEYLTFGKAVDRVAESWKYLQLGQSFINTILLSLGSLFVNVIVCGFGGYALSKLKPKGSTLLFCLVVWTMMMPGQIRLVPNYISYLHFPFAMDIGIGMNLLDTFWPMWLGAGADTFAVLLYKNSFDGLSQSYVDAARIDGCTDFGVFFKIMFPLAMPIVIYQSIGVLSGAWSDFFTPLLVLNGKSVIPLDIFKLKGNTEIKMNTYFMALVFASIPSFLIFAVFQKKILGGVNVGGVKG